MFPSSFQTVVKVGDNPIQEIRLEAESPDKINISFKEGDPEPTNLAIFEAVKNLDMLACFFASSLFPEIPKTDESNEEETQQELPL